MKTIAIIAAVLSLSGVASAAPVDNLYNRITEDDSTLELDEMQYAYCHWLAETNRTDAMRRGLDDQAVQLAYEDTFDYCYDMAPKTFATAMWVSR